MKYFATLLSLWLPLSAFAGGELFIYGDDSCDAFKTKLQKELPSAVKIGASCGVTLSAAKSDVVIFVVNSFNGIRPENRKQLAQLKASGVSRFAVVLTNTHIVDDAELLELETLELIESLNGLGLPGDITPFFLDYEKAPYDPKIRIRKGVREVARFVTIQK